MTNPSIPGVETMLKPCPFCDALTAMLESDTDDDVTEYRVVCQECRLQTMRTIDAELAVSRWNTRA